MHGRVRFARRMERPPTSSERCCGWVAGRKARGKRRAPLEPSTRNFSCALKWSMTTCRSFRPTAPLLACMHAAVASHRTTPCSLQTLSYLRAPSPGLRVNVLLPLAGCSRKGRPSELAGRGCTRGSPTGVGRVGRKQERDQCCFVGWVLPHQGSTC